MKVIGIGFSDLHYAKWAQYNENNERLQTTLDITRKIIGAAIKHRCPILFPGDFIDHPKYLDNEVMEYVSKTCVELMVTDKRIISINGNHDFPKINSFKNPQPGYLTHLSRMNNNFVCVDFDHFDTPYYRVHGIPYINGNVDFNEAIEARIKDRSKNLPNILMIHRDLAGAEEPDGRIIDKDEEKDLTLKKYFKKFDLVISGHIHKPQKIKKLGRNVYMLGSTNQQRRTDANCKMGYWRIMEDFSMEFTDLKAPEFKYIEHDEEPENQTDYFIRLPQKEKERSQGEDGETFKVNERRDKLAKKYLKARGIKSKTKLLTLLKYI
jgi:DNA repair exonuclease SbcCD nuclease subunit